MVEMGHANTGEHQTFSRNNDQQPLPVRNAPTQYGLSCGGLQPDFGPTIQAVENSYSIVGATIFCTAKSPCLTKFSEFGFRLCHNETAVSAMALTDNIKGWPVYGSTPPISIDNVSIVPAVQVSRLVKTIIQMPTLKKYLLAIISLIPGLRERLINRFIPKPQLRCRGDIDVCCHHAAKLQGSRL